MAIRKKTHAEMVREDYGKSKDVGFRKYNDKSERSPRRELDSETKSSKVDRVPTNYESTSSRYRKEELSPAETKAGLERLQALKGVKDEHIDFLRDNLGVDLQSPKTPLDVVYDIVKGRLTRTPVDIVVTPLAYDSNKKEKVEMPPVKAVASLRVQFTKDDKVFVETVPCRPYLEKVEDEKDLARREPREDDGRKAPSFTEEELKAIEGVGIRRDRIYGGFDRVDHETKLAMADGEPFFVDGSIQTSFGSVNVIGEAQLVHNEDGTVEAKFKPVYPEERDEKKVIDLLEARVRGSLELDFFERDPKGKIVTNAAGVPELNKAGRNIVEFGAALEPVVGFVHKRVFDQKAKKYVDKVERGYFEVTAQNGNLYPTKMLNVADRKPDGTEVTVTDRKGVSHIVTHPETHSRLTSDGKVYVDGLSTPLDFKSERDREDYLRGKGGVVVGAVIGTGKDKKVYEGYAFPDNRRGGFATVFSPETSKKLVERREKAEKRQTTRRRKQNYGMGI